MRRKPSLGYEPWLTLLILLVLSTACSTRSSPALSPTPTVVRVASSNIGQKRLQIDAQIMGTRGGVSGLDSRMVSPQGMFVQVSARFRNLTTAPVTIYAAEILLEDTKGRKFSIAPDASVAASVNTPNLLWASTVIQPSLAQDVVLIFDLPAEVLDLTLTVRVSGLQDIERVALGTVDVKGAAATLAAKLDSLMAESSATIEAMRKTVRNDGAIGELIEAEGWTLKVTQFGAYREPDSTSVLRPKAEDQRYSVYVSLGNSGQKTLESNPAKFRMADSAGKLHFSAVSIDSQRFKGGRLDPGEKQIGSLLFDVPRTATPQELRYETITTPNVLLVVRLH